MRRGLAHAVCASGMRMRVCVCVCPGPATANWVVARLSLFTRDRPTLPVSALVVVLAGRRSVGRDVLQVRGFISRGPTL